MSNATGRPWGRGKYHEDDVRVMLSYSASSTRADNRRVHIELESAQTGDVLLSLELTSDQFTSVMSSRSTVARSAVPLVRGCTDPGAHECEVTDVSASGDCSGDVSVFVVREAGVLGHRVGDHVRLCEEHHDLPGVEAV